ncbi:MAG: SpoIIE family protein phosphatase [SAR324 cluster bacterium]|nr:SpoIIE family protein phosphatase [SAR324 cluster bacterium]
MNVDAEVKLQEQLEEANRQLQDSEARFRKMIDESIQGVAIVDAEGEILYINRVFLDTLGFESMEDCMRVPPQERMPPESLELTRAHRAKRLSGEESPERYRHEIYRKDRSRVWVETLAHAIEWEGHPAVQVNIMDVDAEVRSRKKLEAANELMTMGVGYGSRIQQALLPRTEDIQAAFRAFEVSWEPRDVVSGDFYWFHRDGAKAWLMLGDCTGHGVPGAFMSLISLTVLDRIAYEGRVTDPAGMLEELGLLLRKSLGLDRPDAETDDGLDASFCCFDSEAGAVTYSGKILPLYRLRGGGLEVIKGERGSVGYHTPDHEKPFTNHTLDLQAGDRFVLISDGFVDQVCETTGRMYGPKRFRKKLAEHASLPVPELMRALLDDHAAEQGTHTRRDDLTLMALEV